MQQVLGGGSTDGLTRALLRRRDRDASSGALTSKLLSFELSGARLLWTSSTELSVADPEELYKQRGIRQLIRKTAAVSVLGSVPGATSGSAPIPAIYVLRGLQMRLRCVYDDGCASLISKIVDFGRNPRKIILKMFSNPDPEGIFVVSAPILVIYELPRVFGAFCMTSARTKMMRRVPHRSLSLSLILSPLPSPTHSAQLAQRSSGACRFVEPALPSARCVPCGRTCRLPSTPT